MSDRPYYYEDGMGSDDNSTSDPDLTAVDALLRSMEAREYYESDSDGNEDFERWGNDNENDNDSMEREIHEHMAEEAMRDEEQIHEEMEEEMRLQEALEEEAAREQAMEELFEQNYASEDFNDDDDDDEDYIPEREHLIDIDIDDEFEMESENEDDDHIFQDADDDEEDNTLEVAYHAILRIMTRQQHHIVRRSDSPRKRQLAQEKIREHDEKQRENGGSLLTKSGWFGEPDGVYGQANIFGYRENGRRRERSDLVAGLREREISGRNRSSNNKLGRHFVPKQHASKMRQYDSDVYTGQYSEDGTLFYTTTKDFRVHIYDARDPEKFEELKSIHAVSGQWTLTDANLSRDKEWVAYSSLTPYATLSSTDVYRDTTVPLDFNESRLGIQRLFSLRFSGSGKELVAGASAQCEEDRSILLYDIERQKVIDSAGGHWDDVNTVCFADEGSNILISGSDDMSIRVWDRRTLRGEMATGVLVGHTEGITFVSPKGDGRYLVSNGKDQCAKLWDIRTMVSARTADDTRLDTEFDYRNNVYPGIPRIHSKDSSVMTYRGHKVLRTLIRCHFSPPSNTSQRYIYTGSADGRAHIYNLDGSVNQILDSSKIIGSSSRYHEHRAQRYVFGYDRTPCTRDVSWHPYLPNIISSSWMNEYGYLLKHDLLE